MEPFERPSDLYRFLTSWAADIRSPDEWAHALDLARQWPDLSPRNQLLLVAAGATGSVAGVETWRQLTDSRGQPCTVRGGEHAYLVRVPSTTELAVPDPYLGGTRLSRSAVESFEWRPVFSSAQLVHAPAPDQLLRATLPDAFIAGDRNTTLLELAAQVVDRVGLTVATSPTTTSRRRTGDVIALDPDLPIEGQALQLLTAAARRTPVAAEQRLLADQLAPQAAALVAQRLGAATTLPVWRPDGQAPRARVDAMLHVLTQARWLTSVASQALGVDLAAPDVPRLAVEDDRLRHVGGQAHLPDASIRSLARDAWMQVGPHSRAHWHQRGLAGCEGRGAYLGISAGATVRR